MMMSTHDAGTKLDQSYRIITKPLAKRLARHRWITPNRVSTAAFISGGLIAPALVSRRHRRAAGIAFMIGDLLDYLDGDVARAQNKSSASGDMLDGIYDRYTDFFVLGAMMLASRTPSETNTDRSNELAVPVGLSALIGSLMPSYIKAVAVANGHIGTVQSIGGRGTRNRIIWAGLLAGDTFWTLVIIGIISNYASIHRAHSTLKEARRRESETP
ncbi:CDP-alcohol phosphatidyltransferase family protein [Streptomyces sp. NPDC058286]|uniref:CDP-alcohol phosphatidyltransferase family protein n=1 Tax=Streptomyces sp. NPDC058286 TaxID=3346422 RepID=UPI0036E0BE75